MGRYGAGGVNDLKLIEYNSHSQRQKRSNKLLRAYSGAYKKAVHKQGGFYLYLDHY